MVISNITISLKEFTLGVKLNYNTLNNNSIYKKYIMIMQTSFICKESFELHQTFFQQGKGRMSPQSILMVI